eukprot:628006_1
MPKCTGSNIESNVNEIKSKIDLKFKTISKTIRKTKKLLLKSIDRWKEERVCMVQQQIQSLHQDNHSQTQIIIQMKDLTERIDIKFTDHLTIMPSQSAPDYQFAEIHRFKNNCIKIPQFVLQEPEMVSLNSSSIRYKVKLKWNVQNTQQMKDIKHRDVAYYYQKDGVRDRVWRKCENLLFEEKENCVDVELAEWFKCNKTYCFKIEYHGKYPFEYTIVSPTQRYSFKTDQNALHKMKLCYLKHRGHFNDCHPMNLLFSDDTNYKSQINATFGHSCDYDWVMFKFDDKQYIPSTIFVRNHDKPSAVAKLTVLFGDPSTNKWFETQDVKLNKRKKKQYFEISGFDSNANHCNINAIKLVFKTNFGQNHNNKP